MRPIVNTLAGIVLLLLCFTHELHAQREQPEQSRKALRSMIGSDNKSIVYTKFFTGGIVLNMDGYSLNFRRLWTNSTFFEQGLELDLGYFRHPKEYKISTGSYIGKRYVYGKINTFFDLRLGYGRNVEIADKRDVGSIEINYFYFGGLSLALMKPVWIEYQDDISAPVKKVRYDPDIHENQGLVFGGLPFYYGFSGIQPRPGIYAKVGMNFDYTLKNNAIGTVEVGFVFDYFFAKLPIFADNSLNKSFFSTFYISVNFGKRWN